MLPYWNIQRASMVGPDINYFISKMTAVSRYRKNYKKEKDPISGIMNAINSFEFI